MLLAEYESFEDAGKHCMLRTFQTVLLYHNELTSFSCRYSVLDRKKRVCKIATKVNNHHAIKKKRNKFLCNENEVKNFRSDDYGSYKT